MTSGAQPFAVKLTERTHMVVESATGRCLGAVGSNFYNAWVFPLYTPAGLTVVQEFPFDHPFHNGCYVRQHPVIVEGRIGNFWASPPRRGWDDHIFTHVGRVESPAAPQAEPHECGVRFTFRNIWRDENEQPMIEEVRTIDLRGTSDATICDMISRKISAYGAAEYPQTKFGAIGIRVEPRLLPPLGGEILADAGRRGSAGVVHEKESDFVAYENVLPTGRRFGVLMHILEPKVRGPWFIRDYGMALFNPTWTRSISVLEGESWTVGLRIVAYDDALTEARAQAWLREADQA